MTRTQTEKREYSRGYNRGRARMHNYAAFAFKVAKTYRTQAKTALRSLLGKDNWASRECQTCERWHRGGPGHCKWGICSADFLAEVGEPMMWPELGDQIATHEDFGCCNHLAENPLRKQSGDRTAIPHEQR